MVEVEIFGMSVDEENKAPIIGLKDEQGRVVPIVIGAAEAMAITMAVNQVPFPRPMTHDLLMNVIRDLGGTLTRVEITNIENGTFFAELIVSTEAQTLHIDSRPSDAIALAVRAECPIYLAESVIEETGVLYEEINDAVVEPDDSDKLMEELDKLTEEDTEYKM